MSTIIGKQQQQQTEVSEILHGLQANKLTNQFYE